MIVFPSFHKMKKISKVEKQKMLRNELMKQMQEGKERKRAFFMENKEKEKIFEEKLQ